jgi:hypothetical protein
MNTIRTKWEEFRELFIAAHHNPIARRREDNPYQVECRKVFDELDKLMSIQSTGVVLSTVSAVSLGSTPDPTDLLSHAVALATAQPDWMMKAVKNGQMVEVTDPQAMAVAIGNLPVIPEVGICDGSNHNS